MRYILASGSPRRKELLGKVVKDFEIIPAESEEMPKEAEPSAIVEELSLQKASEIFHKILTDSTDRIVVIGADTVVSYNHRVLGKPKDREDAKRMLLELQGKPHEVCTGVTVFYNTDGETRHFTFHEETKVFVEAMTQEEIDSYVQTGEPDDKAGAYGVQGLFAIHIKGIEGDYYNVVGLPVARLYKELKNKELL